MRRVHARPGLAAVLTLSALLLTACGGGEGGGGGEGTADAGSGEAASAAAPVQVENPATITGTVAFAGAAPAPEPIDMTEEPECAQKHQGQPSMRPVAVQDGKLANVFVYVKEGLSGSHPAPAQAVVLDQVGCEYTPHVVGVQTGQRLTIRNSDPVAHNIKAVPREQRGFNISQPSPMETQRTFSAREVMIPVECNIHGWMKAYVGVLDHPYFAVTREDGTFSIPNLPPGSYVLETWHETLGTRTLNVTVGPNESKAADFSYAAGAGQTAVVPLGRPLVVGTHPASHGAGADR